MLDVLIVGGGIAGQTAAIYAARKRLSHLLLAKHVGGQYLEAGEMVNYPGIVKTSGIGLYSALMEQMQFNNVRIQEGEEVKKIDALNQGFRVSTDKNIYTAKTLIIATGARPRRLNVPGEERLRNRGVTYCAICDGPLFSGLDVAVVGGGSAALEAVGFLKDIAKKIYVINIGKKFTAHTYLIDNVMSLKNVEIIFEAETQEIVGGDSVEAVVYKKDGRLHKLKVQGVVVSVGRIPATDFLKGFVELDEDGHVIVDCQMRTSVPGVFAAGDCTNSHEYQYVIAAGQGCMALLKAAKYLEGSR